MPSPTFRSVPLVAFVALLVPGVAHAHFELTEPACYSMQDLFGGPQKSAPCGQDDPDNAPEPTGAVTTYTAGQTVTLTVDERIFHPGHYRVSIASDMASLPADPPVTAGSTACGSTVIEPAPTLPLVADGLLAHTSAFSAPQTVTFALPAGFTCDHCTLQVSEFMSQHPLNNPGGCFYHHCAVVSIVAPGAPGSHDAGAHGEVSRDAGAIDAGTSPTVTDAGILAGDSSTVTPVSRRSGCSYRTHAGSGGTAVVAVFVVASLALAKRRRLTRRAVAVRARGRRA